MVTADYYYPDLTESALLIFLQPEIVGMGVAGGLNPQP